VCDIVLIVAKIRCYFIVSICQLIFADERLNLEFHNVVIFERKICHKSSRSADSFFLKFVFSVVLDICVQKIVEDNLLSTL